MDSCLYIHIGAHKTGTTALQDYFHINRSLLKENGVLYPGVYQNHHRVAFELTREDKPFLDPKSQVFEVFSEIAENTARYRKFILSSEGFLENDTLALPRLVETLTYFKIKIPVKIVLYCRHQPTWIESDYQQDIKQIPIRTTETIREFIREKKVSQFIDYDAILNRWAFFFGKENMIVVLYKTGQISSGIFDDFKQILRLPKGLELSPPSPMTYSNAGFNTHTVEFLRWLNILKIDDFDFEEVKSLLNSEQKSNSGGYHLIPSDLVQEINRNFEQSNKQVALEYCQKPDGILFQHQDNEKPNDEPVYQQQDKFIPESFSRQISQIKDHDPDLLESIYYHLLVLQSTDLIVDSAKNKFAGHLKKIIPIDNKQILQNKLPGIRYKDAKLIQQTESWTTELTVTASNFLEQTFDHSGDIKDNISVENSVITIFSKGIDPYFFLNKTMGFSGGTTLLMVNLEAPTDTFLQVFFQTTGNQEYILANSFLRKVQKGLNTICVLITHEAYNGKLRIDPGSEPGLYLIHKIEIRSGKYLKNDFDIKQSSKGIETKVETTLFLHVGPHKTGTTAIQNYLWINKSTLKENGILYPGKYHHHALLFWELQQAEMPYSKNTSEVSNIFTEISESIGRYRSIILSCESFYKEDRWITPKIKELLTLFNINIPVKIILTIRAQAFWVESAYQQSVKGILSRSASTFGQYLPEALVSFCNYYDHLNRWASSFGKENIIVVPGEAKRPPSTIFADFRQILGIPDGLTLREPVRTKSNAGLKSHTVEFLRWLNIFNISNADFEEVKSALSGETLNIGSQYNLLTPELADHVYKETEVSNKLVALEYLSQADGKLFHEPEIVFQDGYHAYCQYDEFYPQCFHHQINLVREFDPVLIESIYLHLCFFHSDDLAVMTAKYAFAECLDRLFHLKADGLFQYMLPGIRYKDAKLIHQTAKWEALLTINSSNFNKIAYNLSNDINDISVNNGIVCFVAGDDDPSFCLGPLTGTANHSVFIKIKLESQFDSILQVFFQTTFQPVYTEENSKSSPLKNGINTVCFLIQDEDFNGHIRIDPGNVQGSYTIHEIVFKKAPIKHPETTLFIHIGAQKTGSTAIQKFFHINREILKNNGLLYPGRDENHCQVLFDLLNVEKSYLDPKSTVFKIFTELKESIGQYRAIMLSCEGFGVQDLFFLPKLIEILRYFNISIPVKIIYCCREQCSWVESIYQQLVKVLNKRSPLTFHQHIHEILPRMESYFEKLNRWSAVFGQENMIVVPYEIRQPDQKIFTDFKKIFGIAEDLELMIPLRSHTNVGYNTQTLDFLRWLNILKINDYDFYEVMELLSSEQKEQAGGYNLLSPELANEITSKFEQSNSLVAVKYCKQPDGILFHDRFEAVTGDRHVYRQLEDFIPESFHHQISLISDQDPDLLEGIRNHLMLDNSSELTVIKAKNAFLSYCENTTQLNQCQPLFFEDTRGIRYRDFKLLKQTENQEVLSVITSSNFYEETCDYSEDIKDELSVESSHIRFFSKGNDPHFSLAKPIDFTSGSILLIIKAEIPGDTHFQVFFKTWKDADFVVENSCLKWITKGINTFCFLITDKDFNGRLRLDPGFIPGEYSIHEIMIKQMPGQAIAHEK